MSSLGKAFECSDNSGRSSSACSARFTRSIRTPGSKWTATACTYGTVRRRSANGWLQLKRGSGHVRAIVDAAMAANVRLIPAKRPSRCLGAHLRAIGDGSNVETLSLPRAIVDGSTRQRGYHEFIHMRSVTRFTCDQ